MNENNEEVRYEQLKRCIPDIFTAESILYVGGHYNVGRNLQMLKYFDCPVDCVEVWFPNVRELVKDERLRNVWKADIRDWKAHTSYDVTMFWHGVEHITKEETKSLIKKMNEYTKRYIVFATPNGIYKQGEEYGNPYEIHKTHWYVEDFIRLGMEADAIGEPDKKQGNIIAWTRL